MKGFLASLSEARSVGDINVAAALAWGRIRTVLLLVVAVAAVVLAILYVVALRQINSNEQKVAQLERRVMIVTTRRDADLARLEAKIDALLRAHDAQPTR